MMFSRELYVIVDDVTLGLPKSIKGRALVVTGHGGGPGPVHTYILEHRLNEGFEIQSQLI